MVDIVAVDFAGVEDPYNPGMTYPEAWALQNEVGESLTHQPRCSSVPGWCSISGPAFLCDCGALLAEHKRRRAATTEGSEPHVG